MKYLIMIAMLISFVNAGNANASCVWSESIKTTGPEPKVLQFHNICYNNKHYVGNLSKDFSGVYHIEAITPLFDGNNVRNCDCKTIQKFKMKETQFQIIEVYEE